MNEFLAIIGDTWRQSKQQVVFMIMIGLLLLLSVAVVVITTTQPVVVFKRLPGDVTLETVKGVFDDYGTVEAAEFSNGPFGGARPRTEPAEAEGDEEPRPSRRRNSGVVVFSSLDEAERAAAEAPRHADLAGAEGLELSAERRLAFLWNDTPIEVFRAFWFQIYAQSQLVASGERVNPNSAEGRERLEDQSEADRKAFERSGEVTHLQMSTEVLLFGVLSAFFSVAMLLFIAAASGYFPGMLQSGAIDVVAARPISRFKIYAAKYFGGLVLFAIAVGLAVFVLWAGIGLRTGFWAHRVFVALPVMIFSAAVLYAILALVGTVFRSTAFAMIFGYLFYVVVDTALGAFIGFSAMGMFEDYPWVERTFEIAGWVLPNFEVLKGLSTTAVMSLPHIDWAPIGTGAAWILVTLGLGYNWFRTRDY